MSEVFDVVVVGCGITGAGTAYHLKKFGVDRVLLLERRTPAAGGTGKSAAIVRQHYSNPLPARLAMESVEMFAAMPDELGADGGYKPAGWFFLVPPDFLEGAKENVVMQQTVGVDTRLLDDQEISEMMPWLNTEGVAGVAHEPKGGYADPVQATEAYLKAFKDLGGEARISTPARTIIREDDNVTGVITDEGSIAAGAVVNAAGPWAALLAQSAGIELEVKALREQDTVWEARVERPLPTSSISNAVDAIYVRPLGGRRYVVGRGFPKEYFEVDPNNYKETVDEEFVSNVATRLQHRFPPFVGATRIDSYGALYDVTPDWYPFTGPRAGLSGYFDACGGSGHGFKIAPALSRHLARWIVDGTIDDEFARLSHDRLGDGRSFVQAYGGNRG